MDEKSIRKALETLKKEKPGHFQDLVIFHTKEHWKKHYPELFVDEDE